MTSCINKNRLVSLVKYNDKYGFIDTKGKWIIEPKFDSLGCFYNGFADCYKDNKAGIINSKGDLIVQYHYDFIGNFDNNLALVLLNDSVNYINIKGEEILQKYVYDGEDFSCGYTSIQLNKDDKWCYINTKGEIISKIIYDFAGDFKNNQANVEIGDIELIIDNNFNIIDTIKTTSQKHKFRLIGSSNNNTLGMVNSQGDTIMSMSYKSFGYKQDNIFFFNNGDYYGLADTSGNILTKNKYEYLSYFSDNGLALAKLNGKYGFINRQDQTIIDFQYDDARGFKYDLSAVKKNEKWGFIDKNGNYEIKPIYDYVGHQFRPIFAKYERMYNFEDK